MDEERLNLTISSSPHAHSRNSTKVIMRDVCIAMLPALIGAIVFFGFRALTLTMLSVAACVFFEWGYRLLMKKDTTVGDWSAAVTGMLIAFVCPVTLPYWVLILGDFFAIIIVKQLFGGIGMNIVNPALAARAFMMLGWPTKMSNVWTAAGDRITFLQSGVDAVTVATPMQSLHAGVLPADSLWQTFLGSIGGCLGEVSVLLLLIGAAYLVLKKVITLRIPIAYIATVAVIAFIFPLGGNDRLVWVGYQVCSGGLMLGALFMATDYTTSPVTHAGQVVYGVGCGLLTILFRYFGSYVEGVSFAILLMNCCVGFFDRIGLPKQFGFVKPAKTKKGGDAK